VDAHGPLGQPDALTSALQGLQEASRAIDLARERLSALRDAPAARRASAQGSATFESPPKLFVLPAAIGDGAPAFTLGRADPAKDATAAAVEARRDAPSVLVRMLGRFEVSVEGRVLAPWRSRRARQLFEYLLLNHREQISRHQLMGVFWPDYPEGRAENNLSLTVMALRRLLGASSASTSGELIGFSAGCYFADMTDVGLDVDDFESHVQQAVRLESAGDNGGAAMSFDHAIEGYGGELLPVEIYEDWTATRRRQLQDRFADALRRRARLARMAGDDELPIRLDQRLLELDAADEAAHRQLILDYLHAGQRSRAAHQAEACREALARHLGAAPDAETLAVFAQIEV
jgi:DNA-binding SARP family transcriptional activator